MKKAKTLPKLKKDAEKVFNAFIRRRDEGKPCISCGQFKPLQAGHFYAVKGYDGLRYDEDNVAGECSGCNCFDESHLIGYAENLLIRIGPERFDALRKRAAEYKQNGYKFNRAELQEIIENYR
jgi:hypothetical protein